MFWNFYLLSILACMSGSEAPSSSPDDAHRMDFEGAMEEPEAEEMYDDAPSPKAAKKVEKSRRAAPAPPAKESTAKVVEESSKADHSGQGRSWFPETFLFEPLVETNEAGLAQVPVPVPDRPPLSEGRPAAAQTPP